MSTPTFAGGKLVYKPDIRPSLHETGHMLGLNVDVLIDEPVHIEGFYGAGKIDGESDDPEVGNWYKADTALMAYWGRFGWGVGYAATYFETLGKPEQLEHLGYGKFALTLW
jgi:hypothetical protein